ncbi:IS110 family transposase, partial [Salmonella enterica subsp. enterica]|nr:IS110 family transposase [Salmonella enterica subsp. enterica]
TPVEKTSGSSVRGRPHMSKTGPSGVRAKLYVAALGAVMRKLVHLCFGVLKTRLPWDENYVATA